MALRIGDHARNFTSEITQGPVEFYDWKPGRWAVDIEQTEGVAPNFPVIGDNDGAIARTPQGWIALTPYVRVVPHPPS